MENKICKCKCTKEADGRYTCACPESNGVYTCGCKTDPTGECVADTCQCVR